MDRTEQVEKQAGAQENDTALRFHDELNLAKAPMNISREAQEIANYFDYSKNDGRSSEAMADGAKRLSNDLQQLSGDIPAYNRLLKEVATNISNIPPGAMPMTPELKLGDIDPKTGSYKNAFVYINADSWDSHEAYRIVQPGNTLSQIIKDSYQDLLNIHEDNLGMSRGEFMQKVIENNNIEDPNKIKVGQVLKMDRY